MITVRVNCHARTDHYVNGEFRHSNVYFSADPGDNRNEGVLKGEPYYDLSFNMKVQPEAAEMFTENQKYTVHFDNYEEPESPE